LALEIDPKFRQGWVAKGIAHARLGEQRDSVKCYDQALSIQIDSETIYQKGLSHYHMGRYREALDLLRHAEELAPGDRRIPHTEARVYWAMNEPREAALALQRCLKIDPNYQEARMTYAVLLSRMGYEIEALEEYDKLLAGSPEHMGGLLGKGGSALRLGLFQEALDSFRTVLAVRPKEVSAWLGSARALEELGLLRDSLGAYDEAVALSPEDSDIHMRRSALKEQLGDAAGALEDLTSVYKIHPSTEICLMLARLNGRLGEKVALLDWAEKALKIDTKTADIILADDYLSTFINRTWLENKIRAINGAKEIK
jgi:tetratricopeptide (TPR) repeat protein